MTKGSKIAILIPQFYWGGMPKVASHLIKYIQSKYKITLILVNNKLEVKENFYSANVIRLSGNKIHKFFQLKKLLKDEKFLSIISFGIIDNLLNIILSPRQTKRIITEHSTKSFDNAIEKNKIKKIFYFFGMKYLYNRADEVVAVSSGIKDDLEKKYGVKNVKVIYNLTSIEEQTQKLSLEDENLITSIKAHNGLILLNVGRITLPKGQLNLVKALKHVNSEKVHLVLIGEGSEIENIFKTAQKLGLEKQVHFIGSRKNVISWMKNSDFYVSLSWFEGFPTAYTEAIRSKLPIISADVYSGPRELLSNGKLVDYKKKLNYPAVFQNGILTERFDFRKKNVDFENVEIAFAEAIKKSISKNYEFSNMKLDFFSNEKSGQSYERIINKPVR